MGAARYVDGKRELNVRGLNDYLKRVLAGEAPTFQSEQLEPEERARETAVIQLRRSDGIDRQDYLLQTGFSLDALMSVKIAHYTAVGLLEDSGERVRLTRRGKCVADGLVADLL